MWDEEKVFQLVSYFGSSKGNYCSMIGLLFVGKSFEWMEMKI